MYLKYTKFGNRYYRQYMFTKYKKNTESFSVFLVEYSITSAITAFTLQLVSK